MGRKTNESKTNAKPTDAEVLATREAELRAKYGPRVLKDSIRKEVEGPHKGHLTVNVACTRDGCKTITRRGTGDVWQCLFCQSCVETHGAANRKAKLATKTSGKTKTKKGRVKINGKVQRGRKATKAKAEAK